jgi:hypothetical protein
MPRQAAAAQGFAINDSTRPSILPPADLNALEKAEFIAVVMGSPANHFLPADIATISAYARAVVAERIADGELSATPVVSTPNGDRPSPWLTIWLGKLRACTTLARRLNINPAGRLPSKSDEPKGTNGFFERMALEAQQRDERN